MTELNRGRIIGSRLTQIGHSNSSEPEFILEGIGPATFRAHFLRLDSGIVLDVFTAEITVADVDEFPLPGKTDGLPVSDLLGRQLTAIWIDNASSPIIILDDDIYLRDANDGVYGNPLRAGFLATDYTDAERSEFTAYWTE
jgi:hypothetical protein